MKTNRAGRDLIKRFESFQPDVYIAPEGKRTVGYGHVVLEGEAFPEPLTLAQADELLARDLARFELAVRNAVKVPLTDNQFSALVAFVFNVGDGAFKASSMLKLINAFNMPAAAKEFERWNHATVKGSKVVEDGLTARRKAERELFEKEQETV
jgi:lysozyme